MMPINDFPLGTSDADDRSRRLVADLATSYAASAPPQLRASLRGSLRAQALVTRRLSPRRAPLSRIGPIAAAAIMALGGLVGYLRLQSPTLASAQAILQRAAATLRVSHPNEVTHDISRVYYGPGRAQDVSQDVYLQGPLTITLDQWTQLDATGAISRQVTTATDQTGKLVFRALRQGQDVRTYGARGPGRDWIVDVTPPIESNPTPVGQGAFLWLNLAHLVSEARAGTTSYLHLLPTQSVAGTSVDVVEIGTYTDATILYIDARTYAIRGVDEVESWSGHGRQLNLSMRLLRHAIVAPAAIPPGTFTLTVPAGVPVLHPIPTTQQLNVATAVGQSPWPVPVLQRDVWGLRLQEVERSRLIAHASAIYYGYRTLSPDLVGFKQLGVSIVTGPNGASVAAAMGQATGQPPRGQPMTVTLMGQVVPARYTTMGGARVTSYALSYQQGIAVVSVEGYGLTKAEFFAAIAALVDGKTHPQTRAHLQGELDHVLGGR